MTDAELTRLLRTKRDRAKTVAERQRLEMREGAAAGRRPSPDR
jgi:hypothetical protein